MARRSKGEGDQIADIVSSVAAAVSKGKKGGQAFRGDQTEAFMLSAIKQSCSSGNLQIDRLIRGGRPGPGILIPFGRMTVISGRQHAGKTTLAGQIVARAQVELGAVAVVQDTERSLDLKYWERLGVDLKKIILSRCDTVEDVFDKGEEFMKAFRQKSPSTPVIQIWDSVGLTPTRQELKGVDFNNVAKVIGTCTRQGVGLVADHGVAFIVLSDLYRNISGYGDPWIEYGGEKLLRWATLLIRLTRKAKIMVGPDGEEQQVGAFCNVDVKKNKLGPYLMDDDVALLGDEGFSPDYTCLEVGQRAGVIVQDGSWKKWKHGKDESLGFQGWLGFKKSIMSHPQYGELQEAVQAELAKGIKVLGAEEEA